ncbi:hypothetical protein ACFQ60_42680 [Streptomyces zhihengii]
MIETLAFHSNRLDVTEDFLCRAYTPMRIGGGRGRPGRGSSGARPTGCWSTSWTSTTPCRTTRGRWTRSV